MIRYLIVTSFFAFVLLSCSKDDIGPTDPYAPLVIDSLKEITSNIPPAMYTDLQFINENTGFAISPEFIVQTTDGGVNWVALKSWTGLSLAAVHFTDAANGFILAKDASTTFLLKTTDGGISWSQKNLLFPAGEPVTGIFFMNAQKGFITGNKLFIKTTDGGETWTPVLNNTTTFFGDVAFINSMEGYVTAEDGRFYKTVDGGKTWQQEQSVTTDDLTDLYIAPSSVYAKAGAASLVELRKKKIKRSVPGIAFRFVFVTDEKAVGVGSHYEGGFWPYGDVLLTNNAWRSFETKKYMPDQAIAFRVAAKAGDKKIIMLGSGHLQTTVVSLRY